MSSPDFPPELLYKVAGQIVQDPGIPVTGPTVSAWQEPSHPLANTQSEKLPSSVDYAVIGSGITGCSVAKTLLESDAARDKTVTVFEARALTTGATSRNGGFLTSHAPSNFARFANAFGEDAAKRIAMFCNLNLKLVREAAEAEGLDKESQIREVTIVSNFEDEQKFNMASESVRMYEAAVPNVTGEHRIIDGQTAQKDYKFQNSCGAIIVNSRVFWPYRLVTNLFQRLLERHSGRFSVETNTPVTSIELLSDFNDPYPYTLETSRGTVKAAKVFHCVSGFTGHLLPKLRGPLYPCRLSMSTQEPGPQWGNRPMAWLFHVAQSYDPNTTMVEQGLYWMQQNAETGKLFFGGDIQRLDDYISSDDSVISSDSAVNLINMLPKRLFSEGWNNPITNSSLPSAAALHRIWCGILSMTADQNPIVGSVPVAVSDRNNEGGEWVAAGFNGYGMVQCWLSGQAIARMALGEPKPDWLPDVFLSTMERLTNKERMSPEAALNSFFDR